jgi:hypothetical protein
LNCLAASSMDGASPMGGKAAAYGASLELPVVATGIPRQRENLRRCRHGSSSQDGFHEGWVNGRKLSCVKNGTGARYRSRAALPQC